jgi:signal transduction histidine kinase
MLSILYVDDDERLLEVGKVFLEHSGTMNVNTCRSASEALGLLEFSPYDAIISDYEMPGMNGIEFLQHLRQRDSTLPFLIFTGRGREDVAIAAFDSGADYYVQKGGDTRSQFAELINKVQKAIERRRTTAALKLTSIRLNLLLGITRHDILNNLTVLVSCNEVLASRLDDAGARGILDLQARATDDIKKHIDFMREYDSLGIKGPAWQSAEEIASRSFAQFLKTVSFRCDVSGLEIYADPMMEKVFYNLFDNAVRYGEGISEIRLSCVQRGSGLVIIFCDDGAGVLPEDKERIFQRGYGKNTGLGLFLSREILSITGMEIHETGEYHKGARFEILVPAGYYRFGETCVCPAEYCRPAGVRFENGCCERN